MINTHGPIDNVKQQFLLSVISVGVGALALQYGMSDALPSSNTADPKTTVVEYLPMPEVKFSAAPAWDWPIMERAQSYESEDPPRVEEPATSKDDDAPRRRTYRHYRHYRHWRHRR